MGGSSTEVGRHWRIAYAHALSLGPLDAFLGWQVAEQEAWAGRITASAALNVNRPELLGGEEDQGGVVGLLNVQFGTAGQLPNSYALSAHGPAFAAYRGVAVAHWEGGRYGANNPYAPDAEYRVERIVAGWEPEPCWYPAKAPVPLAGANGEIVSGFSATEWRFDCQEGWEVGMPCVVPGVSSQSFTLSGNGSQVFDVTLLLTGSIESKQYAGGELLDEHIMLGGTSSGVLPVHNVYSLQISNPPQVYYLNHTSGSSSTRIDYAGHPLTVQIASDATVVLYAASVDGLQDGPSQFLRADVDFTSGATPPRFAMNPAHMILEAHCDPDGADYERDSVDLAHLQVQADWYYDNAFGLCWVWDSSKESASQYIERIEEVAACSWARNHADGKWRLTVANGVYDFGSLPIITDDDILSFSKAKLDLSEAINSVSVKYFDPALKEEIITIPVRADDLIKAYGLRHKTYDFLSIPIDHIAARVAQRMLDNHTKERWVFNMDTNRKANGFVKNTYFRLQVPKRGISDMVCIAMEVDHAALKSGGIRLMAHEEIYSLPLTVYTGVQPGGTSGPDKVPKPIVHQRAIEAPYIDLASTMSADALAALAADAGFAVGMAADPGRSRDFSMLVAPDGGAYIEVGKGAFCPTAVTVAQVNPMDTYVLLTEAQELAGVSVGDLVLMGDELRIVEAVDLGAVAVTLSLACADTVPALHPAGTRLFFYANRAAYDPTEHTEGEALEIKLLTNSSGKQVPESDAVAMDLTMARRQDRPYPPGNLMINGLPFYGEGNTAPPTSGGGGGGGGPPHPPATTPTGVPASTTLGPNGGYADNAPHPVPQPTVYSTDLIPDGTLSGWTDPAGRPLGGQWSIEAGGMVYQGAAPSSAVYEPAKLRMSQYPLPRWQITVSAEIQTEIGQRAALGVAWGTSNASSFPYSDASTPQEYPVPTTVTHTYAPAITRAGLAYPNVDVIQLIMPLLVADAHGTSRTRFRNVSMTVEQVPTPVTVATIANLGFASGLTGWTQWPAPNAVTPTLSVVPGGVQATGVSADGAFTFLINDDPITLADVAGKALRMRGEFWSNDPTVITPPGVPRNGASLQIAVKPPGGEYIVLPWQSSSMYRGDWTPREIWQIAEVATAAGYSVHLAIRLQQAVGYSSGVRNISVAVTDDPVT